ncbi:MAG: methionine biosynthesis protein MetW [Pelagibacterales bacterium]|nr:methionine biosynthesis protein MetW [Pelagibacterales bacterium]OUV26030.1 MAG: methionine biosynthesis protein MetW [Alphaproteobacteria bacterium TMED109]RCL82363.1 MAG: methionine biosynthesis protein MetW [Alphaproteobacteria bacterium]|tara:strand:+ start:376 stop:978 length:603 start_codon:yes stop_codon:yes gene_type:complete
MTNKINQNLISSLINNNDKVLDIGCGNGDLLYYLEKTKNIQGQGIEISHLGVKESVTKGLSVIQGDADEDLVSFTDNTFDVVILSDTLQATHKPKEVLKQMLRIGKKCIICIPNFGYWKYRLQILFYGIMPVTKTLSEPWYSTPNIHLCTIKDFINLCNSLNIEINKAYRNTQNNIKKIQKPNSYLNNLLSTEGIFILTK